MNARKLVPLLVVIAGLLAYHNSFTAPFIFDDTPSILKNYSIRHLWPIWDALTPSAGSLTGGRPVVNLSFALSYALGGSAVWGYHAFNLAIHIFAGLTLYGIVRRTLLQPLLRERFGQAAGQLALAVAVLWTVHPLQTEAVTYISQRCESLMGLLYLLTLYCFIRGANSPKPDRWFALSVAACLLGMASKEAMVTAPLMVLLYDRTFVSRSFREAWKRHGRTYLGLASTWLLLGYLMVGLYHRKVGFGLGTPWWAYALTESRVVIDYLRLALCPHPLVFDYGEDITIWHFTEAAPYALILAVLGASVLFELRRLSPVGLVGAWFFVILAPASSVVPVVGQPMAEHRMYLPLAAVVTLGVMAIYALLGRRSMAVFLALAMGLGLLTVRRNEDYRSELSIWNDTVAKSPDNARAHLNLGKVLLETGQSQAAMAQFEQALRIKPDYTEAHVDLGIALSQVGSNQDALAHFMEALRRHPESSEVHYNLGLALQQAGRATEAVEHFEQALRIKPDYAEAHYHLGIVLENEGRTAEAISHFEKALRTNPDFVEAHINLGSALLQMGNEAEAVAQYEQALRISPDYAEARSNLGVIFQRQGKLPEAVAQYELALRGRPDYVEAHFNLGLALEKLGRRPEAIEHYQQALKLRPGFIPATKALARLGAGQ